MRLNRPPALEPAVAPLKEKPKLEFPERKECETDRSDVGVSPSRAILSTT